MNTQTITVKIEPEDGKILREGGYRLCFGCQLKDEDDDVIWYAAENYAPMNQIELLNEFEVFASMAFSPGEKLTQDFPASAVNCGEQCIMDEYGNISSPRTGNRDDAVVLINKYGPVFPGISRKGKGIKKEAFSNPFFISMHAVLKGEFEFLPSARVRIWFAQDAYAGKMFKPQYSRYRRSARTYEIVVDLEHNPSPVVNYGNGEWKII